MKELIAGLASLALGACCFPAEQDTPTMTVAPAEPAPAQAAPEATPRIPEEPQDPPNAVRLNRYLAQFDDDELSRCSDMEALFIPPEQLPPNWPPTVPPDREEQRSDRSVRIQRPCRDSFRDRTPLATCVYHFDLSTTEGMRTITDVRIFFYSGTVLEDDSQMRRCLQNDGEWNAVDRNSPDADDARLRTLQRRLRR